MMRKTVIYLVCFAAIFTIAIGAKEGGCLFSRESSKTSSSSFSMISPSNSATGVPLNPVFMWTNFDSEKSYSIQIDTDANFASPLIYENSSIAANVTSFNMPAGRLSLSTKYYWRVRALNFHTLTYIDAANGPFEFTTIFSQEELNPPTDFTLASPPNGTTLRTTTPAFQWTNATGEASYTFEISESISFTPLTYQQTNLVYDTTSYVIPDGWVALNKDYYWRVIAVNNVGQTTASNAPFLLLLRGSPPAAFDLSSPPNDSIQYSTTPTMTWGASSGATSYALEIDDDPLFASPVVNTSGITDTSYGVPASVGLQVRVKYYWRVKASNPSGDTYCTTSYFNFTTFEAGIPPDPFDLQSPTNAITDVSWTTALTWNDSIGEEFYTVQVSTGTTFATPLIYQASLNKDTTTYTMPSGYLTPNTLYYWRIIATNSYGMRISGPAPNYYFSFTTSYWSGNIDDQIGGTFPGRAGQTAVWTGKTADGGTAEVIIWGGKDGTNYYNTGYRYRSSDDSWTEVTLVSAPASRSGHTAIWTGKNATPAINNKMLIWGGFDGNSTLNTGGVYDPVANTWTSITTTNAPNARADHIAVWTGSRMVVWGGGWIGVEYFADGKSYNPVTDSWTNMNPATLQADTDGDMVIDWGPVSFEARAWPRAVWGTSTNEVLIHGGWDGSVFLKTSARYSPSLNQWTPISTDNSACPSARAGHTTVWAGSVMMVWGGQYQSVYLGDGKMYNPVNCWPDPPFATVNGWLPITDTGAPQARAQHTAVWASERTEMLIWGGKDASYLNTGRRYNIINDSWSGISTINQPSVRADHCAVWTGTEMIVWGGTDGVNYYNNGGRYDPATDTWTLFSFPPPVTIEPRRNHTVVWTGQVQLGATGEMIMWGGDNGAQRFGNGGRYNPNGDIWSPVTLVDAPAARTQHTAVWTGTDMVIWGGWSGGATYLNSGAVYSPTANTWTVMDTNNVPTVRANHSAVWADSRKEMIVWGGWDGLTYLADGGRYYPATNTWNATTISTASAPSGRINHTAVWSGTEMVVFGGLNSNNIPLWSGARYNSGTNSWTTLPTASAPVSRAYHTAIWTGNSMIIWGGATTSNDTPISSANYTPVYTGALYYPTTNTWLAMTTTSAPVSRTNHTAVWTGTQMIVWGGWDGTNYLSSGSVYSPSSLTWVKATENPGGLLGRVYHSSLWNGTEMIIWGGAVFGDPFTGDPTGYTNTAAKYRP